jgi:hypothetical protein
MPFTEAQNDEVLTLIQTVNFKVQAKEIECSDLRGLSRALQGIYESEIDIPDPDNPGQTKKQKQPVKDVVTGDEISDARRTELFTKLKAKVQALP